MVEKELLCLGGLVGRDASHLVKMEEAVEIGGEPARRSLGVAAHGKRPRHRDLPDKLEKRSALCGGQA